MGFSVSASAAIIGVSILVILEVTFGNILPTLDGITESYDIMTERDIDRIHSDMNIINLTSSANGSGYDLNFSLQNTGSVVLDTNYFDILINGTIENFTSSSRYIYPEKSANFSVYNLSGSGNKRLKVISDLGITTYSSYSVS